MTLCKKNIKTSQHDKNELIKQYNNFVNKYYNMFTKEKIDFKNYDVRVFLSCYLKEKKDRNNLIRGKYHSKKDILNAYRVLNYLKYAFEGLEKREIYHELLIPFLKCADDYKDINRSFKNYLYKTYRYNLMRHLNTLLFQNYKILEKIEEESIFVSPSKLIKEEEEEIEMGQDMELNSPLWLNGKTASATFGDFEREDRLILIKYYLEDQTDKEIGRLVGRGRRSINRSRNRIVDKLKEKVQKGDVKWARWMQ